MFATRNGHEPVVRALAKAGADLKATNGDGATATIVAIVNDRFDLAKALLDLGADPDDGSLYFAVDMHDATTDMRARDGSRLRADHSNTLTSLDLVRILLDRGANPNKAFIGQLHSTTLCCGEQINASPFFRAAIAADVEALQADAREGGPGGMEPDRGQEGVRQGQTSGRPRQPERRQDAGDAGDGRRTRRRICGRTRVRAPRRPAIPRGSESRRRRTP